MARPNVVPHRTALMRKMKTRSLCIPRVGPTDRGLNLEQGPEPLQSLLGAGVLLNCRTACHGGVLVSEIA